MTSGVKTAEFEVKVSRGLILFDANVFFLGLTDYLGLLELTILGGIIFQKYEPYALSAK